MPTSNGLSYSMNSFPRIACTMGAFSLPASSISSWWAPAQPAPARIVVLLESFRTFARRANSSSEGHTDGFGSGKCRRGPRPTASSKATSREDDDRDTTPRDRGLHRDLEDAGHLLGMETSSQ